MCTSARLFLFFILLSIPASLSFAGMRFDFTPRLTFSEEYTDNVFLDDEDKESEWITIVSPGLTLNGRGKTTDLSLDYSTGLVYYSREEDSPPLRHNLAFNLRHRLSRYLTVSFSDSYTKTDETLSQNATAEGPDVEFIDRRGKRESYYTNSADISVDYKPGRHDRCYLKYGNYLREDREPVLSHDVNTGYSHEFGRQDSVSLDYSYRKMTGRDPDIEDSLKNSPSLNLTYWPFLHLGMEGSARYTRGEFEGDTADFDQWEADLKLIREFSRHLDVYVRYHHNYMDFEGEELGRDEVDYQVYDPSIGINYQWTEDTFVNLGLGYFYLDNDTGKEDESGISINGDIGRTWRFKRGSFNITGGTGYDEDYFGSENLGVTIYQDLSLGGSYEITKRLTGRLFADYRRDEYVNREPERTDQSYTLGGGFTWVPVKWLRVSLDDDYRYMDSDDPDQNYTENRVILKITWTPGSWRLN